MVESRVKHYKPKPKLDVYKQRKYCHALIFNLILEIFHYSQLFVWCSLTLSDKQIIVWPFRYNFLSMYCTCVYRRVTSYHPHHILRTVDISLMKL